MGLKSNFFILIVLFVMISCDKKQVFDQYEKVGKSWHKNQSVLFEFDPIDTIKPYDLFLNIRNNKNYPFSNLFLIVEMEQPDKNTLVDTLEYVMANPDGTLLGKGFSDVKESKLYYKENYIFKNSGVHRIKIQHAMRQTGKISGVETLDGVMEVGFRVESK
ncbi:MAG: gliding motility lipoprotein GldH [Flavobacteriaceae bacterium]|nr:gliding motility lipoprotein GldH [Flavobacteriaceae bacterium]